MIGNKSFLIIFFASISIILLQTLIVNFHQNQDKNNPRVSVLSQSRGIHNVKFFDEQLFNKALIEKDRKIKKINYHIY